MDRYICIRQNERSWHGGTVVGWELWADVGVPRVSSANLRAAASFPKSTIELDTLFKSDSPNVGPSAASPYLFA